MLFRSVTDSQLITEDYGVYRPIVDQDFELDPYIAGLREDLVYRFEMLIDVPYGVLKMPVSETIQWIGGDRPGFLAGTSWSIKFKVYFGTLVAESYVELPYNIGNEDIEDPNITYLLTSDGERLVDSDGFYLVV